MLSFILSGTAGFAQSKLDRAREYKENFEFSKALELYNEIYKNKDPKNDDDIRDIANCYLMVNDTKAAQEWLSKITSLTVYRPDDMLNFASALKTSGKYDEAKRQYRRYEQIFPNRSDNIEFLIEQCDISKEWLANPMLYDVQNIDFLNSENSDFGLISYSGGFLFSSDRRSAGKVYKSSDIFGWTGNPFLKLYSIDHLDKFEKIHPLDKINVDCHNGPGIFDENTNTIYYSITKRRLDKKKVDGNYDPTSWRRIKEQEPFINRIEIYLAKFEDGEWVPAEPFPYNDPENYSVGHPALSPDGNILYFTSDMPGGQGKSDIYYCEKQADGSWGKPHNAGASINTKGRESFPYVGKDGVLYFSSDEFPGMGGFDIFAAYGSKDNWTEPENLKAPINSPKDDFAFVSDDGQVSGYFSSNRDGGLGMDDIYSFNKRVVILCETKIKVSEDEIVLASGISVDMKNMDDFSIDVMTSDENGQFTKEVECGSQYELMAFKKGFFTQSKGVMANCDRFTDTIYVDLIFEEIKLHKTYVLENIYYDFDKWNIRPDAAIELDKLVRVLKENPDIDIELGSHTDSRGTFKYNDVLSQKRAESAVDYIVSRGINSDRITAKGYGERRLRNKCKDGVYCSEDAHQLNRRTEFKVTNIREDDYSNVEDK